MLRGGRWVVVVVDVVVVVVVCVCGGGGAGGAWLCCWDFELYLWMTVCAAHVSSGESGWRGTCVKR